MPVGAESREHPLEVVRIRERVLGGIGDPVAQGAQGIKAIDGARHAQQLVPIQGQGRVAESPGGPAGDLGQDHLEFVALQHPGKG
jgi:hypothetical protein